jgi:hypothetical protein
MSSAAFRSFACADSSSAAKAERVSGRLVPAPLKPPLTNEQTKAVPKLR